MYQSSDSRKELNLLLLLLLQQQAQQESAAQAAMQELLAEEEQAQARAAAKQAKTHAKQRQQQATARPCGSDSYHLPLASQLMTCSNENAPTSEPHMDAAAEEEYSSVPTPFTMDDIIVKADFQPATPMPTGMRTDRSTAIRPMAKHMPDLCQPACTTPVVHDLATAVSMSGRRTNDSQSADSLGDYKPTGTYRDAAEHTCKTVSTALPLHGSATRQKELQSLLSCPLTKVQHGCYVCWCCLCWLPVTSTIAVC